MKKGFTLVELLAVIVIISITSLIIFPTIGSVITASREDLYNSQILDIEEAAKKWATDNLDLLDQYHVNDIYIDLNSIKKSGYLEKDAIKNPITKEEMVGCIQIKYDLSTKQYNHVYQEKTCTDYTKETEGERGYIIYNYNNQTRTYEQSEKSNIFDPAGLAIYKYYANNNLIKVDGETVDGLYELDNEYVFRGLNPNNYVTLQGKDIAGNSKTTKWRILSIDKKDYSLKLISATAVGTNLWDSNKGVNFKNATSNVKILAETDYAFEKIITSDFKTDIITGDNYSVRALTSTLKDNTSLKNGLISIIDYVNASATYDCPSNYLSNSCKDNNYLYSMFGTSNSTWTLNTNGSQVWYIDNDGLLKLENSDRTKQLYAVVKLDSSSYITNLDNAVGSQTSPYLLK